MDARERILFQDPKRLTKTSYEYIISEVRKAIAPKISPLAVLPNGVVKLGEGRATEAVR